MNRPPAFQFYPDKALAGTLHLSDKAFRAYWRCVWFMWLHSDDFCSIQATKKAVLFATGLRSNQYDLLWCSEIMSETKPMFRLENGRYVCNGLRKEYKKHSAWRQRAKHAADTRWNDASSISQASPKHEPSMSQASPKQCTPSPSLSLKEEDVVNNTQGSSTKERSPNAHNTTAPSPQEAELNMLVKQFTSKCVWTGGPAPVYKHLRALLQHYRSDEISAQIAKAKPGTKPWDIADALNKAARTCEGDVKPYRPEIPPGAGPIDKDTIAKCFAATRKQIKTEASA